MSLYLLAVVFHVLFASLWFGAPLAIGGILRRTLPLGQESFKVGAQLCDKLSAMAILGSLGSFLTGISLIFIQFEGFGGLPPRFHIAMTLVLVGIILGFAWLKPMATKLIALAEDAAFDPADARTTVKRLSMGIGINHLMWLITLVLMFWK